MEIINWIRGDSLGLDIPAHSESLKAGGATFLTHAFRAAGSIAETNAVSSITHFEEISGGSTGRKLLLCVEYAEPSPELHTELFIKFSRDFSDGIRDRAKFQMELEVQFALLSRSPAFPIAVPVCYFSDFNRETGTGILITERVPYGAGAVEPHYAKCLDYHMPDQLGHYKALMRALAQLAGTHKAGRFSSIDESAFSFDPSKLAVSQRDPYTVEQISQRVEDYLVFTRDFPQLLPEHIRTPAFLSRLTEEAPRFQAAASAVNPILCSQPEMIALCHWNAHVDNAWFWRDIGGQLDCGLMDWGNTSQMNIVMAIWGCLSAAELPIWNAHLDELLLLFVQAFRDCGGPALDLDTVKLHLNIYIAMMGLTWLLDVPKYTFRKFAELPPVKDRYDPRIEGDERVRSQLQIMIAFLNRWEKADMASVIDYMESFG